MEKPEPKPNDWIPKSDSFFPYWAAASQMMIPYITRECPKSQVSNQMSGSN